MKRPGIKIQIPEIYIQNESKGLCKVCGKDKTQWEKGRQKYCGDECFRKYQDCFISWGTLRDKIIKRDKCCLRCASTDILEVDHIKAFVNGGDMWDQNNLQTLCHKCHCKKTKKDIYLKNHLKKGQNTLHNLK